MNRVVVRLLFGMVCAGAAQTAQAQAVDASAPLIPARFHGEWNSELERCGDRESGTNLIIDGTSITYFEAGDQVIAVRPAELDGITVTVDHQDEYGIERLYRTLILSDDQQKLSFTYGDGPESVVLRCPQGNQDGR